MFTHISVEHTASVFGIKEETGQENSGIDIGEGWSD
jgi:hypothetical protein